MTEYLGWDCANVTLAWSHVTIDTGIIAKLAALLPDLIRADMMIRVDGVNDNTLAVYAGVIGRFRSVMSGFFTYHSAGVIDLLDGAYVADCDEVVRTRALHRFLTTGPVADIGDAACVVIERQNNIGKMTNRASTIVSAQLGFYYVDCADIIYIDPGLKNQLTVAPHLDVRDYIQRQLTRCKDPSAAKYIARKKHARDSFVYLLDLFGHSYILDGVSRRVYDDLADSTMEILADVRRRRLLG